MTAAILNSKLRGLKVGKAPSRWLPRMLDPSNGRRMSLVDADRSRVANLVKRAKNDD